MSARFWTIAEASAALGKRDVSPVELVEDCLRRIEVLDPTLHSYVLTLPEQARAAAKAAETEIRAGGRKGPQVRRSLGWLLRLAVPLDELTGLANRSRELV